MLQIRLDRNGSHRPYYLQIQEQIRDRILSGELAAGILLTPSRQLALELGISRQTVVNAYEELCAQGYCLSRVGHGTVVADLGKIETTVQNQKNQTLPKWLSLEHTNCDSINPFIETTNDRAIVSFESGLAQTDCLPFKAMEKAFREVMHTASSSLSEYKRSNGHPALIEAICRVVLPNRGIQATPEQLFITNGSLHSSFLLAELLSSHARSISYGVPGYLTIPRKFTDKGITAIPCTVDLEGIYLDSKAKTASLHYVMPEHHFPQGVTLSPERRAELLKLAEQNDSLIIEDDYDSEFYFDRHPLPALKAIDSTQRVIYMGTFSKVLFNGLRLGYIVAHPTIVRALVDLRWKIEGGSSIVTQLWLAQLLNSGAVERHLRRMRVRHRKKRNLIADYLRRYFPYWQWRLPAGGLHFWIQLPPEQNAEKVIQKLWLQGIQIFSGFEYCEPARCGTCGLSLCVTRCSDWRGCDRHLEKSRNYIILGFGAVTEAQIHQAFERLK